MIWKILAPESKNNETISFAVEQLKEYLKRMNSEIEFEQADENETDCLLIGVGKEFDDRLMAVSDNTLDDAIFIDVKNATGIICATNPRSVLIAVYRFLKELGCAFIRPGKDNEVIPQCNPDTMSVYVSEAASLRHREVCIEGATSYEHVADMIDWLPKIAMNGYYMQFIKPYGFFRKWYNHEGNPYMTPEPKTPEELDNIVLKLEDEIAKRDLLYFAVGHSWNSEPLGIEASYWDEAEAPPENIRKYLAEIDGKRDWYKGVPMNTNLCYSNPEVQKLMADFAVNYCKSHPKVKYLVFWMADAFGNKCECEECRKGSFSDFYFQILNKIDEELTKNNIDTKLVFSVKNNLPLKTRIKNPNRVLMMFCPMLRNFAQNYPDEVFERNKYEMPNFDENIGFDELNEYFKADGGRYISIFKCWQDYYHGDTVTYDYQLIWYIQRCPANIYSAKTISRDIKDQKKIGSNGVNSCQVQRAFYPTALPMVVMAQTLWDINSDYEQIKNKYLKEAFGEDYDKLYTLLEKLDHAELLKIMGEQGSFSWAKSAGAETVKMLEKDFDVIAELEVLINRNTENNRHSEAVSNSWKYLKFYPEFARLYTNMQISSLGENNLEKTRENCDKLTDYVNKNEHILHPVIDGFMFRARLGDDYKKIGVGEDVHK